MDLDPHGARTSRSVEIADHLWETLETMSREMGTPIDALLNQSIFTFARFNGYLGPARKAPAGNVVPVDTQVGGRDPFAPLGTPSRATLPASPSALGAGGPPPVRCDGERARAVSADRARALVIADDLGVSFTVDGDRFVIGRGKHCQLVIDSTRVSREHAVIVREADGWWIEDLGSSNGTWMDKQRITRRRLQDGDEFFVCSERFRCTVR